MDSESERRANAFFELAARMQGKGEGKICPESGKVADWRRRYVINCKRSNKYGGESYAQKTINMDSLSNIIEV